jgi:hypothetical protein
MNITSLAWEAVSNSLILFVGDLHELLLQNIHVLSISVNRP